MDTHKKTTGRDLIVADACAGVGPFSIPLASKCRGIQVYANDLNPISYQYLLENRNKNKCATTLQAFNMDGRWFLRYLDEQGILYDHVIMNLPAIAPEFLNVFRGWTGHHRPTLHIYCFVGKASNYREEAVKRLEDALGCSLSLEDDQVSFHIVRDVSPNKNMLCVSFRLPLQVASLKRVDLLE
jgi:tRNA (guanine37-N1)-methyltransferase